MQISTLPVWDYIHDIVDPDHYENQFHTCWDKNEKVVIDGNYVSGANCIKIGDRIILPPDLDSKCRSVYVERWKEQGYKLIETNCDGHTDGVFSCLKPGVIVTLNNIQDYKKNFPGWDILYLPDQSWSKVSKFLKIKDKVGGRWWVPGREENEPFTQFVNEWLGTWVGYVEETVFDVNMLSINEECVIVNNYNKVVFDYLKKHNIEPIIWKQRHRYFWDGGVHCLTVDLEREGSRENYFD
jgi:sporulation protein YlmC with PRC-barrel domain